MGRLVLMRHGESEGNRERRFTRTPAVPLTDLGREQVRRSGEWIASASMPVRIVSSPFQRAFETATILAEIFGLPVDVEDDLRERSYGELAGEPYEVARTSGNYQLAAYWEWRPPGGETLLEVATRAGAVLDRVARAAPNDDVVVVSHGAVMHALWRHVTGDWPTAKVVANAGIVLVEHGEERYLSAVVVSEG